MAHPKRRHSNTRTRKRRTHDALKNPQFMTCSNCREPKMPHRICPNCGYYDGKPVMEVAKG